MGPHATLADSTVRESIMTGIHFWGCKCCGTYNRHNEVTVVQVAFAYFKHEPEVKFSGSGSTSSVDSNLVGISAKGKSRHTDGQVRGSPFISKRVAFDVGIVDPNAASHSPALDRRMWRVISQPECKGQICREDRN